MGRGRGAWDDEAAQFPFYAGLEGFGQGVGLRGLDLRALGFQSSGFLAWGSRFRWCRKVCDLVDMRLNLWNPSGGTTWGKQT